MIHEKLIALTIPGYSPIPTNIMGSKPLFNNLGSFVSEAIDLALYIVAFMAFYYLIWGAFQYIMGEGNKDNLNKAKERIRWALIGLFVVFLAFVIAKFIAQIFPPDRGGVPF